MADHEDVLNSMGLGLNSSANQVNLDPIFKGTVAPKATLDSVEASKPKMAPLRSARPTVIPDQVDATGQSEQKLQDLYAAKDALESRNVGQVIGDAALDVAGGFVDLVGTGFQLGFSGIGEAAKILSPDGSMVDRFGDATKEFAVDYGKTKNWVVGGIQGLSSETDIKNTELNAQISQIESQQNLDEYNQSIAEGDNNFLASITLIGKDLLDSGARVITDPVALQSTIAQGFGSLGPSAKMARAGVELAGIAAAKFGVKEGAKLEAAKIAGSAIGVGVTEGAGTYSSTVDEVMGRTHEQMLSSQRYRELLAQGVNPVEAQKLVADETGMAAFRLSLPAAILAGTIASKFNANPVETFVGKNMVEGFTEIGRETLEEGLQGGASQIAQNLAIKDKVDPNQVVVEGVGEQLAVGAIAGAGIAGILGGPRLAATAIQERQVAAAERAAKPQPTAEEVAAMTPEQRDAYTRSTMNETINPGAELFDSVVGKGIAVGKAVAGAVKTGAAPVVNQVIKAAQNYTEKSNPVIQSETLAAAQEASTKAKDTVATETPEAAAPEAVKSFVAPDESIKETSIPEVFKTAVAAGSSLADTMTGIVKTLAEKKVPISDMADDAVLFVAEKYQQMQTMAGTLPADIQSGIKKVLASPDLERIRKRAARLDLNTAVSSTIEKVSSTVKAMTVAMTKLNPSNVNPDVVDKILKQDDRTDLTPETVKTMEVSANVARSLNTYKENIVQIAEDKYQALKATGQKVQKPETNAEQVSRNLIIGGLTGENKVPSINESANRIIIGMQSPDQSVDVEGVRVPVKQVASNFRLLAQHMINKVNALNESFDNDGRTVMFDTLVRGKDFIKAGMAGSASVYYRAKSENSVALAKTIHADASVLAEVYNTLVKAYPDQFPDGPVTIPALKGVQVSGSTEQSQISKSEETASVAENKPTENTNTTAVEEVPSPDGTDETKPTETTKEEPTSTTAVEGDVPSPETENLSPNKNTLIMGKTQEEVDQMTEDELIQSVNEWEPDVQSEAMPAGRVASIMQVVQPYLDTLGLPANIIRQMAWLKSSSDSHLGQAYWAERVMSLKPSVVRKILAKQDVGGIHIFLHELFHLIDAKASKRFGVTASMDAIEFDLLDGGEVYDEVKALSERDPEFKDYFSYAFSFGTPNEVSSELFAEIGAMMMLMDREEARKLLPKGVAYVEKVVEQAGGVKADFQGNTPSVSNETAQSDEQVTSQVTERMNTVFRQKKTTPKVTSAKDALDKIGETIGTVTYVKFANILLDQIRKGLESRLDSVLISKADGRSIREAFLADQASTLEFVKIKPLALINPETGKYDQRMIDLASMAVIDWLTTARAYGADRLDDLLEELDIKADDLSPEDIQILLNSVPPRATAEMLAKKVIKLWNLQPNSQSEMVDIRGITEGLVKEIFTVLSEQPDPLIKVTEIKVGKGYAATFEISGLKTEQEAIGLAATGSLDRVLFPEDQVQASFGEKLKSVPTSQNNKPDVPLTKMEQAAIKKMQDTAHTAAVPVIDFFKALGLDTWSRMAGKKDSSKLARNHPLRLTIEGKNTSIERDYETAFQMVDAADGREVYYPIGVTDVGRHQMKGINPQNNKLLRAMITPTHSKLDMANNQKHKNNFWLTVAQSSGLAKVEKKAHAKILATIQEDFTNRYGEAVKLAEEFLTTGTLNQEAFADAILAGTKGEAVAVAQVNAVIAVARLNQAKTNNTLDTFETSLSFELDGKTDGPANMMVAFGQGIMSRLEFMNFQRIGLFLGSKTETLNSFMEKGNIDLYEVNSNFGTKRMFDMINAAKGLDKKRLQAIQRFAAHFGDFEIKPDGSIVMSRATSKNPMTKKVYGSGEKGIADGITQDMLIGFYEKLTNLADGQSVAEGLGYPEINQDLEALFGKGLPDKLDTDTFILPRDKMVPFAEFVKATIGQIISDSTKEVINEKTIGVNDLLVFITGVQSEFMKSFFENRLAELAEQRAQEGVIRRNKDGKPNVRQLSQADYDSVVQETMAFAPYYKDGLQNLRVGSFSGQQDGIEMSSNTSGNIRAKSTMQKPDTLGVKVIPYVIQGRGDAMMMNRIFSAENAPKNAIPIFDGIDMAIDQFDGLSDQINEAVLQNWDHDVLSPILENFTSFLDQAAAHPERLAKAFAEIKTKSEEKSSVVALDVESLKTKLEEAVKNNQARKAVFKLITLSVDHMGGSGKAYVRNADGKELTFEEINQMIQDQVDGKVEVTPPTEQIAEPVQEVTEDAIVVTDVATVVDAVIRETKKKHIREAIRAIRDMLPQDARIVMGTPEQIAKWRSENLDQNPIKKLDQSTKGYYDVANNMIFIMSDNPETITHELIHMATFSAVLDHYTGVKKSNAVKNLEVLMKEFMEMDFTGASKKAQQAYAATKAQILKAQSEATPMGDSVALNEFMAWTLASEALVKELAQTPTSLILRLTKVAKTWIQRILGVIPMDMYSNILFNTEMIRNEEFPDSLDETVPENADEEVTPPASNFTNFWIDLLRKKIESLQNPTGEIDRINKEAIRQKIGAYFGQAKDALIQLDQGGFAMSEYQKKTYEAIHTVLAVELRLDTNALISLGKVYNHVINNLTPAMFGTGQAAQDRYSTVMELMGATKNDEGISDSVATLLALSQTSSAFRQAMDQIPTPDKQPGVNLASLNDALSSTTSYLMQRLIASTDTEGKGVKETLDALSDQILRQDDQNEFRALKALMGSFDKADQFVGGALSLLAQRSKDFSDKLRAANPDAISTTVAGAISIATGFLDKDLAKQSGKAVKNATHMGAWLDAAPFIRELVNEIIGADGVNTDVIQMLDKVNYVVQSSRQAYREELPVIFQNEFQTHPTKAQWKDLHTVLGKGDFATLFDLKNPDASFDLLSDQKLLDQKIKDAEKKLMKEFPGQTGANIILKSKQLADFMNGKGVGFQLWKNAYAIHKLAGGKKPQMVSEIDRYVSLLALNGTDVAQRESVANMQAADPNGVHNLLVYVQALNKEEDQKVISEAARMNGYKGYIPNHSKGEVSLIIARDADRENLERRGYVRVSDDTTDSGSLVSRGYYMSTVKQSGNYSQGVLQQVQDTYKGVNATTGLTVNGTTSGVISGVAVIAITDALNNVLTVNDPKNALIPVMDQDGGVLFYERAMNPDLMEKYLQPEANMALMVGAWAGRQVEEKFSHEYNKALVDRLKTIWDNREQGTEGLFIRMDQAKDKIYAESWGVIPPQLKQHIMGVFGEETGFMVRKDMINLALGYRDPSIVDVWTGNHRLPEAVALAVKVAGKATMGDKAFTWMSNSEKFAMGTISNAKDLIVVRSLVVPIMNTQSNVFQLVGRGVGTKRIMKGYKEKLLEIDKLNDNLKQIMGLQARIRLAATDKNKVAILRQQIQVLEDENKRFSVAPLVEAGAYKNISEGITDLDVSITDGKFGDWFEAKLNKLPTGIQTVAKYGLLSKDTAIYKGANKLTQYGDFLAKSIYYDHLTETGLTHDQAMAKVNEEFVNFSVLPGRTRTYLEAMGATWFLTFKIRSMKVALQMMRENPVRSLAMVNVLGVDSSPLIDNLIGKVTEGTLPYSLGWDMLWDAPGMNPWIAATGL